jgi:hypothetical protein
VMGALSMNLGYLLLGFDGSKFSSGRSKGQAGMASQKRGL